jgi:hypothetical protein
VDIQPPITAYRASVADKTISANLLRNDISFVTSKNLRKSCRFQVGRALEQPLPVFASAGALPCASYSGPSEARKAVYALRA